MNAKLLEERTIFKVAVPTWVMRIRLRSDLHVWPGSGFGRVHQLQPNRFSRRRPFAGIRRKPPALSSNRMPVSPEYPTERLAAMSAFGPSPECLPQSPIHPLERLPRHDVAMVIGPATNDRVELPYQVGLANAPALTNQLPRLLQKVVRILLGWPDNQLAVKLAEVLSEKVEPVLDVRNAGFLWRELQAPVAQKLLDQSLTSFSSTSLVAPVMMKSSAYRMRCIFGLTVAPFTRSTGKRCSKSVSNPSKVRLANVGHADSPPL